MMAHLWITNLNEWTPHDLGGKPGGAPFPLPTGSSGKSPGALLARATAAAGAVNGGWHLLVPPLASVHVNGDPVFLGIRALRDRDEIRVPGAAPMFFSSEELMAIEPFAGSAEATCPRCAKPIAPQSPAVRCAGCNTYYHQSEARPCFTYGGDHPLCVICAADTVLSGEYSWTPEGHE